jgi:hypothetical protein
MHKTAAANRARYTLLSDRRRALFELHKLVESVRTHGRYQAATVRYPGLDGLVSDQFARTTGELCGRACQASNTVLERDVRHLYRSLADLSKVWVGLEDAHDLELLVAAYYASF